MKILITGAFGMVGKNIVEYPFFKEHELLIPRRSELDLSNYEQTFEYVQSTQPELVIHCAGKVGGIQANIKEPLAFLMENMDMGRNIVIASKNAGVKKLINLGSSCMYPRECKNPITEDFVLKGELEPTNEGYALAKIVTQRICDYIQKEKPEFQYKTIIPCNLFGRHDKFGEHNSHMIPAVIKKIHQAKVNKVNTVEIWGDGTARREFMYTEEVASFLSFAIENFDKTPTLINLGLGHDYSINEYYATIAKVIGYSGKFVHDITKPVGMKQKLVDIEKLSEFGWKSNLDLEESIRKTYTYYIEEVLEHD
jgi:GDP-L-fucose synthase